MGDTWTKTYISHIERGWQNPSQNYISQKHNHTTNSLCDLRAWRAYLYVLQALCMNSITYGKNSILFLTISQTLFTTSIVTHLIRPPLKEVNSISCLTLYTKSHLSNSRLIYTSWIFHSMTFPFYSILSIPYQLLS